MTVTLPRRHCSLGTPHWSSSSFASARQRILSRVDSPPPSETNPAHSRYSCQNWAAAAEGSSGSESEAEEEARRQNEPELSRHRFLFSFLSFSVSSACDGGGTSGKADARGTATSVRVWRSIAVGMVEHVILDESLKRTGCGSPFYSTVDGSGKKKERKEEESLSLRSL